MCGTSYNQPNGASVTELPQIVLQKTEISTDSHKYLNLEVRGPSLEECRKHFDEIYEEVSE